MNDKLSAKDKDALWARIEPAIPGGASPAVHAHSARYFAAAAAAFLAVGAGAYARRTVPARSNGPLAYANGRGYPSVELFANGGQAEFEDHSQVRAEPGARVELLDNAALRFALKQPTGKATYAVTPGGTRHWTVDTPLATIEVVGTEFAVSSSEVYVKVHVEHGVVIVRGDRVPEHAVRLTAGQSLEIRNDAPAPMEALSDAKRVTQKPASAPTRATSLVATSEATESARVSELMSFADTLRAEGRNEAAAAALQQVVVKHSTDSHAALAAFTLGRLQMDMLHHPEEAKWALERALALKLAPALQSDAKQRLTNLAVERATSGGTESP